MLLTRIIFICFFFLCSSGCNISDSTTEKSLEQKKSEASEIVDIDKPPFDHSISIRPKSHHEHFKWVLNQANIPYTTKFFKGQDWIIWPEKYSRVVNILRNHKYEKNNLGRAHIALDSRNFKKGIKLLSIEAEKGNSKAQADLALEYNTGKHVDRDFKKAFEFYSKAAKSAYTEAYVNLGLMYEQGRGTTKDYTNAALWFKKGAQAGDPYAMWKLSKYLQEGKGDLPMDREKANYWFKKAKSMGYNFPTE